MESRDWVNDRAPFAPATDREFEELARPGILLVEDDPDIRDLLVSLLGIAGFTTVACGTAEEGLEHLREQQFDLVLTDYTLPHRTGAWMLQQASAEGLLDATPAIVVTAHPQPENADGFEVIRKPFDLDELVHRVKWRLERSKETAPRRGSRAAGSGGDVPPRDSGRGGCPEPIELILYVSVPSPRSAVALARVREVLRRYRSSRVKLTVRDVSEIRPDGMTSPVAPRRVTGPRTFILGHVTNPELLLELLEDCVPPQS